MKAKMVVHIGTPKTGTTSIQHALTRARARLRKECGIHFGSTERGQQHTRHISIAKAANGSDVEADLEYGAIMDDFARSGAKGIFFTDELLSSGQPRITQFFRRFTSDFDLHVICYLRRQDYYAESLHSQMLKLKSGKGVPPLTDFWEDAEFARRFDYHAILSDWASIPGATLSVLDFKKEVASPGLLPSFLKVAGFGALTGLKDPQVNFSPDIRLLLLMGLLNADGNEDQIKLLTPGLMRAARTLADTGAFKTVKTTLGRRERERLLAAYAASNERLAADFGVTFTTERPQEQDDPILAPDGEYVVGVLGQLSLSDALMVHKCAQAYLTQRMTMAPDPKLVPKAPPRAKAVFDPSMLDNLNDPDKVGDLFESEPEAVRSAAPASTA